MDGAAGESEARFAAYLDSLASVLAHADRTGPLKDYCTGLLMPGERKSVEPIASIVSPGRASAAHQSLLHFVGQSAWSDEAMLAKVRELAAPAFAAQGGVEAWIVDDTGFQKKGSHSVGVARQYCGRLGKTDNCQIAVTLSIANHHASLPIAYRLYLPEGWTNHAERREQAHVPEDVEFRTKPEIALSQIEAAMKDGVAGGVVLADAGYDSDGAFRAGITALGLTYAVGVQSTLSVWPPGEEPLPPKPWSGRGRKPSRVRHDADHRPVSAKQLAMRLPAEAWKDVEWREGSNQTLSSRFAAVRLRPASREILALDPARGHAARRSRRRHQAALAHRTRLRGIEKRTGPGSLRGARLAGIPPSRQPVHRGLRIPDHREIGFSPLSALAPRKTCPFRPFSIPSRLRSVRNATSPTRLRRCAGN
jgi:SRSO17 transposase